MNTKFKVQIIQWHGTMVIREHEKAKKKEERKMQQGILRSSEETYS